MKKIGIVCDNYKLKKFEEELKNGGFNDYFVNPSFIDDTSQIIIMCEADKQNEIKNICYKVELHFKRGN